MRRLSAALIWTVLIVPGHTQDAAPGPELEGMLTFETAHSGTLPAGWGGGPAGTVSVDDAIVHGGRWSARLERTAASPQAFSTLTKVIPVDFAGSTIEWRGFLRSETVSDFMGLWMRQDSDGANLAFASMQPRQIRGTNDWTEYSITWCSRSDRPLALKPQEPHYAGKVVIIVDEISLSQAEYTAMAFRSSPRAVVVGSTTAGADGNVSPIPLPGWLSSMISGIGVFYPDRTPTQRVGIVADVEARPTIAGIRAGRDAVLEAALRQILGGDVPADRIENMARPRHRSDIKATTVALETNLELLRRPLELRPS